MIIAGFTILACFLTIWKIKGKWINKVWLCFISGVLSLPFFYFVPGKEDDLYRHYIVWKDVTNGYTKYYLANQYASENPGYLLLLRGLSYLGEKEWLPVFTGVVCYSIILYLIRSVFLDSRRSYWIQAICYICGILLIRYMDISGIRNILAATVFAAGLYLDLVCHRKKAWWLYLFSAGIHGIALLYVIARLLYIFYNRLSRMVIKILLLSSVLLLSVLGSMLQKLLSGIPLAANLLTKVMWYLQTGGIGIQRSYRIIYFVLYLLCFAVTWYVEKYIDKKKKYKELYEYTSIILCMSMGFIGQRELFNRQRMLIIPLLLIFFAEMMKSIGGEKWLSVKANGNDAGKVATIGFILMMSVFAFAILYFGYITFNVNIYYDNFFFF